MVIRGTETVSYQVPMDWRLGFDGAAADFVDGVLEGRQPAQDVQAARHMVQVPLAIYESGRTGTRCARIRSPADGLVDRALELAVELRARAGRRTAGSGS